MTRAFARGSSASPDSLPRSVTRTSSLSSRRRGGGPPLHRDGVHRRHRAQDEDRPAGLAGAARGGGHHRRRSPPRSMRPTSRARPPGGEAGQRADRAAGRRRARLSDGLRPHEKDHLSERDSAASVATATRGSHTCSRVSSGTSTAPSADAAYMTAAPRTRARAARRPSVAHSDRVRCRADAPGSRHSRFTRGACKPFRGPRPAGDPRRLMPRRHDRSLRLLVRPGAAPTAATVPTTRAAESDLPTGLLIAATLALAAGAAATRLRCA